MVAQLVSHGPEAQPLDALARRAGEPISEVADACALLWRWGLLDKSGSGAVALASDSLRATAPLVLLAENTSSIAHVVDALLDSDGYRVLLAGRLPLALKLALAIPFDLVITDSFANTATVAVQRLAALRDAVRPAPVLVFTAHREFTDELAQLHGFAGVLPKPFDIDELLNRVAGVIAAGRETASRNRAGGY